MRTSTPCPRAALAPTSGRAPGARWRTLARGGAWAASLSVLWLLAVWPPPVWWRSHWPARTAMMRAEGARAARPYEPTPLASLSPLLLRMVVIGEDSRFWTHHGIDPAEIAAAVGLERAPDLQTLGRALWTRRARLRGASTITQQLAKNLYLSRSRSLLRKLKEAATALRLELALPKTRILELYLNTAEWGNGVWGATAASRAYFGVPPAALDEDQAAALAATLPQPRSSTPALHPARMLARQALILARFHGLAVTLPEAEDTTTPAAITVPPPESLPVLAPPAVAPDRAARGPGP